MDLLQEFIFYMGEWDTAKEYARKAYDLNHTLIDFNADDAQLPVEYSSVENILALEQTFDSNFKWTFYVSKKLTDSFDKDNDKRFAIYFEGQ